MEPYPPPPPHRPAGTEPAGLGVRAGARVIDFLIVFGVLLFLAVVTGSSWGMPITGVLAAGYEVLFVWFRGATPGKRALGLRVVVAGGAGPGGLGGPGGWGSDAGMGPAAGAPRGDEGPVGRAAAPGVPLSSSVFRWAVLGAWALLDGEPDPESTGLFQLVGFVVIVVAVVMIATRPDRRGPHDLVGSTQVVRTVR
jgi:uncharacterized RDD family membrane protein YckC